MILIGGSNVNFQLVEKSTNKNTDGIPVICPPIELEVESSSILSYSVYNYHSVMIDDQHRLFGIGFNNNGEINRTLPKEKLEKFTKFSIKDDQNRLMILKAVHCGYSYTLYLVTDPDNQTRQQLAYSFSTNNPEICDNAFIFSQFFSPFHNFEWHFQNLIKFKFALQGKNFS